MAKSTSQPNSKKYEEVIGKEKSGEGGCFNQLKAIVKEICSPSMVKWQELVAREGYTNRKPLYFIALCLDLILRGISQVFLCNHPVSGIFICIGLAWTSFELLGYALLATTVASFSATVIARPPKENVLAGLCGYDGALVGCACWAFLDRSCSLHACWLLSILAGILCVACANILKVWTVPNFTFAFNIVMIMMLFAIKGGVVSLRPAPPSLGVHEEGWTDMSVMFAVDASIRGVGQFMFCDTTIGSAFVIAGIALTSRKGAMIATLGAIVGWVFAFYVLHVTNTAGVRAGLFGYNCAGTCSALSGGIFYKVSDGAILVGIIGATLAALLNVGIAGMLDGLPTLTFPFIISTWIIMLSRTKWLSSSDDTGFIKPLMRRMSFRTDAQGNTTVLRTPTFKDAALKALELSRAGDLDDKCTTAAGGGGTNPFPSPLFQRGSSKNLGNNVSTDPFDTPTRGKAGAPFVTATPEGRLVRRASSFLGRRSEVVSDIEFQHVDVPFLDYVPSLKQIVEYIHTSSRSKDEAEEKSDNESSSVSASGGRVKSKPKPEERHSGRGFLSSFSLRSGGSSSSSSRSQVTVTNDLETGNKGGKMMIGSGGGGGGSFKGGSGKGGSFKGNTGQGREISAIDEVQEFSVED